MLYNLNMIKIPIRFSIFRARLWLERKDSRLLFTTCCPYLEAHWFHELWYVESKLTCVCAHAKSGKGQTQFGPCPPCSVPAACLPCPAVCIGSNCPADTLSWLRRHTEGFFCVSIEYLYAVYQKRTRLSFICQHKGQARVAPSLKKQIH